ncbi:excalibur calcium-binding domain-containing protein [Arthrobacter sp. SX1312]
MSEVACADCTEATAVGAATITAGDPGFSPVFDGKGAGVGCES